MPPIWSSRRWSRTERRAAHDTTTASSWLAKTSHKRRIRHPIKAQRSTAGATELLAKAAETTAPNTLATTVGNPEIRLRSPASCAILLGQMRQSRHVANLRRKLRRLKELAKALKVISQPART
jgi:hypothetical protein